MNVVDAISQVKTTGPPKNRSIKDVVIENIEIIEN